MNSLRNQSWFVPSVIMLLMIILSGGVLLLLVWWHERQPFNEARQAYLDAGGAPSVRDIELPEIPNEKNAASLYLTVWPSVQEEISPEIQPLMQRLPVTLKRSDQGEPLAATEVEQLLDAFADELDIVIEASRREVCVWDPEVYQVDKPWAILLPWLAPGRTYIQLLCLRALRSSQYGDDATASESLRAAMRLANHLAEPPVIITLLVRANENAAILRTIERMHHNGCRPDNSVIEAVERMNPRTGAREAILLEGLFAMMPVRDIDEILNDGTFAKVSRSDIRRGRTVALESIVHNAAIIDTLPHQRVADLKPSDEAMVESAALRVLVGVVPQFDRTVGSVEALRSLALAAFDLRDHYKAHGEYPETWEMPEDPVSGTAMHYERSEDGGFILRSETEFRDGPVMWQWK